MIIEFTNNAPDYLPKGFRIFCWKIMNGFAYVNGDQMYVAASDEKRPFINKGAVYHLPKDWYELVCYDTAEFDFSPRLPPSWYQPDEVKQPVMRVFKHTHRNTVLVEESEAVNAGVDLQEVLLQSGSEPFSAVYKPDGSIAGLVEISWGWLKITPATAG